MQGDLLCDLSSHCGFKIKKAKGIVKAKRVFDCAPHAVDLQRAFGIDITNDLQMSLPNTFYRPSMERTVKAIEANLVSRCMVKVYDWSKHAANTCKVNIVTPSPAKHFTHAYIYIYSYACTNKSISDTAIKVASLQAEAFVNMDALQRSIQRFTSTIQTIHMKKYVDRNCMGCHD